MSKTSSKATSGQPSIELKGGPCPTVTLHDLEVAHPLVYKVLEDCSNDAERLDRARQMLAIGALAMEQGRVVNFLSEVKGQVAHEMQQLQAQWEIEQLRSRTAQVGLIAERHISNVLVDVQKRRGYEDTIQLTGAVASEEGNRTGDVQVIVQGKDVPSGVQPKITIESKMSASISYGEITRRSPEAKEDTVLSQVMEAQAVTQSHAAIIVLDRDRAKSDIKHRIGFVHYEEGFGFICLISWDNQDFTALEVAYSLARAQAIRVAAEQADNRRPALERAVIRLLLGKLNQDLTYLDDISEAVLNARKSLSGVVEKIAKYRKMLEYDTAQITDIFACGCVTTRDLFRLMENELLKDHLPLLKKSLSEEERLEVEQAMQEKANPTP